MQVRGEGGRAREIKERGTGSAHWCCFLNPLPSPFPDLTALPSETLHPPRRHPAVLHREAVRLERVLLHPHGSLCAGAGAALAHDPAAELRAAGSRGKGEADDMRWRRGRGGSVAKARLAT